VGFDEIEIRGFIHDVRTGKLEEVRYARQPVRRASDLGVVPTKVVDTKEPPFTVRG
jgi:hypothetical protein